MWLLMAQQSPILLYRYLPFTFTGLFILALLFESLISTLFESCVLNATDAGSIPAMMLNAKSTAKILLRLILSPPF